MSEDDYEYPPDVLADLTDQMRERDDLGEMTFIGDVGFHTFFNPNRCSFQIGPTTALHMAFEETIEELWLDDDIVRDNQGEVTPETIADEARLQMENFIGQLHFFDRFTQNLEDVIREYQEKMGEPVEVTE